MKLNEWQPIATAPKDGTHVLLWWPYWLKHPIVGCHKFGIWFISDADSRDNHGPTHWMSLPDPPKAVERDEVSRRLRMRLTGPVHPDVESGDPIYTTIRRDTLAEAIRQLECDAAAGKL